MLLGEVFPPGSGRRAEATRRTVTDVGEISLIA
jgi:hypothetical protein